MTARFFKVEGGGKEGGELFFFFCGWWCTNCRVFWGWVGGWGLEGGGIN